MGPSDVTVRIASEDFVLMAERTTLWRDRRTLLVADLHLGKAETFQSRGLPLPGAAVLREQLARLHRAVRRSEATRVLILGDLMHAPAGLTDLLVDEVGHALAALDADVLLVSGNHDRRLGQVADRWPINLCGEELREGPFCFVHDPTPRRGVHTWGGHVHPAVAFGGRADRVKLPCFVVGQERSILPAFSRFAAGGVIEFHPADVAYAIGETSVFTAPGFERAERRCG